MPKARNLLLLRRLFGLGLLVAAVWGPYPRERLSYQELQSTPVLDRNDAVLYEIRGVQGGYMRPVSLANISELAVGATLASEDHNFYLHPGLDPVGIARALWLNLVRGRAAFGGSTLTQQLAKMLEPRPRTLLGKLAEAVTAVRLELALSKSEILEQYLNRAYYGRQAYGIEAAAQRHFGKSAAQLSPAEAVLLAIQPRSPRRYQLGQQLSSALQRKAHVITRMLERGYLRPEMADAALSERVALISPNQAPRARHLLDQLVPAQALQRSAKGSLRTTVDLRLQEQIVRLVARHLDELEAQNAGQAGVVVIDNASGEVLAMVGSRAYEDSARSGAVNVALSLRPPGSTLKPFLYALGVERDAAKVLLDAPINLADYHPRALHSGHWGPVRYEDALGSSLNTPAVRLAQAVGIGAFVEFLDQLGLQSVERASGLSLALGGTSVRLLDLTNAYATLARGGEHFAYRLLIGPAPAVPRRVLSPEAAFIVSMILSDTQARERTFGIETPLELPFPVAVKTGTSQAFCDNWTVGYTPELSVGVWVGNFNGRPLQGLLAMQGAAPLFRDVMLLAMAERPRRKFVPPKEARQQAVCPLSGLVPGPHCPPHVLAWRMTSATSSEPQHRCDWHTAEGLRMPPELVAAGPAALAVGAEPRVQIVEPAPASQYIIDPLVPRKSQQLRLSAVVEADAAKTLTWFVDGEPIATTAPPFISSWELSPGTHQIHAVVGFDEAVSRAVAVRSLTTEISVVFN